MPARLIVNPVAGSGRAKDLYELLKPSIQAEQNIEVMFTEGPGHATELAREVSLLEDMTVISLGGDGTHHEVINGLMPAGKCVFAVIPAGTGNDFVRVLSYPTTPRAILETALRGSEARIDIGQVSDQYFLSVSGVGFDAEVAGWIHEHGKTGNSTWVFIRAILRHLVRYRSAAMTLYVDGISRSERTFLVAVGNTAYYAGGMHICPNAAYDDNLFDVVWVRDLPRLSVLPLLARVFRGTHIQHPVVQTFQTEELSVDGPPEMLVHADGEIVGHLPATFRIHPQAIRVRKGTPNG